MKNQLIQRLLDEYVGLADGPRNQALLGTTWLRPNLAYLDDIGIPQPGMVPVVAVPQLSMWAHKMGRDVTQLCTDPMTYLEVFLSREVGRFRLIQDDRPLNKRILIALGAGFEATLLGARQVYSPTEDPWLDPTQVIKCPEDLSRLNLPDFHRSGLMSLAHQFYEELSVLLEGSGVSVVFPDWGRSPFGVALMLRGVEQLLVDMAQEPDFFLDLLRFVTECAIHYREERATFLGVALDKPVFHDDDVNVPGLSPKMYRDLILPLEKDYAAAFGGLVYWHSCGNVTPMIPMIREIPGIDIFHCGPWTDVDRAAQVFGDVTLDVCVDSMDVYRGSESSIRSRVSAIVRACKQHGARSFSIRPGILHGFGNIEENVQSIARWVEVARATIDQEYAIQAS